MPLDVMGAACCVVNEYNIFSIGGWSSTRGNVNIKDIFR